MSKQNTFIIPLLRTDLVRRCLETLYKYTPPNFYVYLIDQTIEGVDTNFRDKYPNLMIIRTPKSDLHYTGNLGHSQATNLGLKLVETPYVTMLNDDVEFINDKWWNGALKTFDKIKEATPSRPALLVNVASIKLPDWSVGRPKGEDFYIMPYKENYTDEDWDFLVNKPHYVNQYLTIQPDTVIDGINLYCSVCDTEKLLQVGSVDNFFYPGNANDYDLCARASMFGFRCVGTTLSWVFHHWSQTFEEIDGVPQTGELVQNEIKHSDLREKWWTNHDLWGVHCECGEILHTKDGKLATCPKHPDQIYPIPPNTFVEL